MLVCEKNNDSLLTVEAEIFIDDFNFFIFIGNIYQWNWIHEEFLTQEFINTELIRNTF